MKLGNFARYLDHVPSYKEHSKGFVSYKGFWALLLSILPPTLFLYYLTGAYKTAPNAFLLRLTFNAMIVACFGVVFVDVLQAMKSWRYANSVEKDRGSAASKLYHLESLLLSSVKEIEIVGEGEPPPELADIYDSVLSQTRLHSDMDKTDPRDESEDD